MFRVSKSPDLFRGNHTVHPGPGMSQASGLNPVPAKTSFDTRPQSRSRSQGPRGLIGKLSNDDYLYGRGVSTILQIQHKTKALEYAPQNQNVSQRIRFLESQMERDDLLPRLDRMNLTAALHNLGDSKSRGVSRDLDRFRSRQASDKTHSPNFGVTQPLYGKYEALASRALEGFYQDLDDVFQTKPADRNIQNSGGMGSTFLTSKFNTNPAAQELTQIIKVARREQSSVSPTAAGRFCNQIKNLASCPVSLNTSLPISQNPSLPMSINPSKPTSPRKIKFIRDFPSIPTYIEERKNVIQNNENFNTQQTFGHSLNTIALSSPTSTKYFAKATPNMVQPKMDILKPVSQNLPTVYNPSTSYALVGNPQQNSSQPLSFEYNQHKIELKASAFISDDAISDRGQLAQPTVSPRPSIPSIPRLLITSLPTLTVPCLPLLCAKKMNHENVTSSSPKRLPRESNHKSVSTSPSKENIPPINLPSSETTGNKIITPVHFLDRRHSDTNSGIVLAVKTAKEVQNDVEKIKVFGTLYKGSHSSSEHYAGCTDPFTFENRFNNHWDNDSQGDRFAAARFDAKSSNSNTERDYSSQISLQLHHMSNGTLQDGNSGLPSHLTSNLKTKLVESYIEEKVLCYGYASLEKKLTEDKPGSMLPTINESRAEGECDRSFMGGSRVHKVGDISDNPAASNRSKISNCCDEIMDEGLQNALNYIQNKVNELGFYKHDKSSQAASFVSQSEEQSLDLNDIRSRLDKILKESIIIEQTHPIIGTKLKQSAQKPWSDLSST